MKTLKKIFVGFINLFGIPHNNRYVKDYLNASNMRSAVYMSSIIVLLEMWMIVRRFVEDLVPLWQKSGSSNYFMDVFSNTSGFWLLLSLGITMLFYSLLYLDKKRRDKHFIVLLICAGITIVFTFLFPLELYPQAKLDKYLASPWKFMLLILLYSSIMLFAISTILAAFYQKKGGKQEWVTSVFVISCFAFACLVFGVRVSYSDFGNVVEHKQIICFLMMSLYVGCLLIWKPYVSVGILGTIFLLFHLLLTTLSDVRPVPDGDVVNYITFFISLSMVCISIYNQRVQQAKKDEILARSANVDSLTELHSFEYFIKLVGESINSKKAQLEKWVYLFLDITSFKIFNDQKGFAEGNKFLYSVGQTLSKYFQDGYITRQSDDHFLVFCPYVDIEEKLAIINEEIGKLDLDIRPGIKVGAYIFRDENEDPHQSVEKARYACGELKHTIGKNFLIYDTAMHDNYRLVQYVVRNIDRAIENGWLETYYQPIVLGDDNSVCEMEALVRWNDEKYGNLSPAKFIPALENAQLIYKLDIAVFEIVCKQLKHEIMNDLPVVPVSVNFSRADFALLDMFENIEKIASRYKIPRELISIEITESALSENAESLKVAMKKLKEKGYSLWLDDFGSGYSSLNVLKEYDFDLLKLDMRFLSTLTNNDKSRALISSVISMAKQIGMSTICEGVEREEQADFLKSVNCDKLQGYLFGKPVPYKQMQQMIEEHKIKLSGEIKRGRKVA